MSDVLPASERSQRSDGISEYVERLVAAAPVLSLEQRDRLSVLLRPESGDHAGDAA